MKPKRHEDDINDMYIISEPLPQKSRKIEINDIFTVAAGCLSWALVQ